MTERDQSSSGGSDQTRQGQAGRAQGEKAPGEKAPGENAQGRAGQPGPPVAGSADPEATQRMQAIAKDDSPNPQPTRRPADSRSPVKPVGRAGQRTPHRPAPASEPAARQTPAARSSAPSGAAPSGAASSGAAPQAPPSGRSDRQGQSGSRNGQHAQTTPDSGTSDQAKPEPADNGEPKKSGLASRASRAARQAKEAAAAKAAAAKSAASSTSTTKRGSQSAPARADRAAAGPARKTPASGGATKTAETGARPKRVRKARLNLVQVDAWSVMKTSFLLSIALGIVTIVAVTIVWLVLGAAGVFDSVNESIRTVLGNDFEIQDYLGTGRVVGFTMVVAAIDVLLLTAIATLAAFLYNLAATLLGGVEVTLAEDN